MSNSGIAFPYEIRVQYTYGMSAITIPTISKGTLKTINVFVVVDFILRMIGSAACNYFPGLL